MQNQSYYKYFLKMYLKQFILGVFIVFSIPNISKAEHRSELRKFLNPIHFNFSMGYGRTYYYNQTVNVTFFEKDSNYYIYNPAEENIIYLVRWFGDPYVRMKLYEGTNFLSTLQDPNRVISQFVGFKGEGNTFPISISGYMNILKKFRLELGTSIYIHKIKTLSPEKEDLNLSNYTDPKGMHYSLKIYLGSGLKLLENDIYTLLLNIHAGFNFSYGEFKRPFPPIYHAIAPIPIGIGLTFEKRISEYVSIFSKVLYEIHSTADKFVPISNSKKTMVFLDQRNISLHLGVTLHCPEIPRCPLAQCDVKIKHKHSGISYRGVSIFKGKNSLGYNLYKK